MIGPVGPLHAYDEPFWGRRILIFLGSLVALAAAGYVGSVVGPHFASKPPTTTTTTTKVPPSTTTSTVAHASVKVLVANGTQAPNAAGHFAQVLQGQGWNVETPQNTNAAAPASAVYYAPFQQQAATLIAQELGLPSTTVQPVGPTVPVANLSGAEVVVVIGPDLAGNGFPATTTT